jgi:acyl-CoA reductase-like NAD-dependent aldehyde dehydrogenase
MAGMNMLIGGALVPAADGARYPTYSPATGELLAEVPTASAADVQRAA